MDDIFFGEEDSKYIKKKSKKRIKKIKHKHSYSGYYITTSIKPIKNNVLINYCTECGKIRDMIFSYDNDTERAKTIQRLKKQGRIIDVDNLSFESLYNLKYVPIQKKEENDN